MNEEKPRYGCGILRSLEDGITCCGPLIIGEAAKREWIRALGTIPKPKFKLIGFVWLKESKPITTPPYLDLVAEPIPPNERGSDNHFVLLQRRR